MRPASTKHRHQPLEGAKLSREMLKFGVRCGVQVLCRGGAAAMWTHRAQGNVIPGHDSTESACKIPVQKPTTR